jgi:flagellar protein FliO/FliZ
MKYGRFLTAVLVSTPVIAQAAQPQANAVASAGNFFQVLMGLIAVLAVMAVVAWLLKRLNLAKITGAAPVKIVGGVSVGNRERVIVVEVADQWIVVGVAAGQVNALSTLPRPETAPTTVPYQPQPANSFAGWLQQKVNNRNAE